MPKFIDLSDKKLGRLLVIEKIKIGKLYHWKCKCDCGNYKIIVAGNLNRKDNPTRSCGCLGWEKSKKGKEHFNYSHGHSIGGKRSKTLQTWSDMMSRCYNSKNRAFIYYGGRGIKVCDRWLKFENFLEDMGIREDNFTIERIDTNGNYEPSNCKWATQLEQVRNARSNINIEYHGKIQTLSQWCEELNLNYSSMHSRIHTLKWDAKDAFELKKFQKVKYKNRNGR